MSDKLVKAAKDSFAKSGVRPLGRGYLAGDVVIAETAALKALVEETGKIDKPGKLPDNASAEEIAAYVIKGAKYSKAHRVASLNYAKAWDAIHGTKRAAKYVETYKALGLDY